VAHAYREMARAYHPDRVAHLAPEFRAVAERKMREINEAYDLLTH
jgi:DnaJ like chaperone protein